MIIPQIILIVNCLIEVVLACAMNGQDKPWYYAKHYGWVRLFDTVFLLGLLCWGGFFDVLVCRLSGP